MDIGAFMNYINEFEKAIMYIEENLCKDLKVEDVAKSIGYSYYHFGRVFEAFLGETIGNYIRKRRLAQAAYTLIYTDKKIIEIAFDYHFESAEAFTRAFKKVYRASPHNYRKNRIEGMLGNKKELSILKMKHLLENVSVQPIIKEISPIKVVGMRKRITLENNQLPQLWDDFMERALEIKGTMENVRCFGICEYEESTKYEGFNEQTLHSQVIAMEVEDFRNIPDGMIKKVIDGGKYAVFTHKGRIDLIKETYNYIFGTWVPYSKLELDFKDDFEHYDERYKGRQHDSSEVDIYIPIK